MIAVLGWKEECQDMEHNGWCFFDNIKDFRHCNLKCNYTGNNWGLRFVFFEIFKGGR